MFKVFSGVLMGWQARLEAAEGTLDLMSLNQQIRCPQPLFLSSGP